MSAILRKKYCLPGEGRGPISHRHAAKKIRPRSKSGATVFYWRVPQ